MKAEKLTIILEADKTYGGYLVICEEMHTSATGDTPEEAVKYLVEHIEEIERMRSEV